MLETSHYGVAETKLNHKSLQSLKTPPRIEKEEIERAMNF